MPRPVPSWIYHNLVLLTVVGLPLCACAQEAAPLEVPAAMQQLVKPAQTRTVQRGLTRTPVRAGRVYDTTRQFVVETRADGTVTEMPFVVLPILFQKNSTELLDVQSRDNVQKLATLLKSNELKGAQFQVEGHTCTDGGEDLNLALSKKRAARILKLLTEEWEVSASGISHEGFGETCPAAPNDTEAHKQLNRRVVIVRRNS